MILDTETFELWMSKIMERFDRHERMLCTLTGKEIKEAMYVDGERLLDNQDLCLLFKVSIKTLQRYRAIGALPYFTISGKVYYKASDVREFIKERFSVTTLRQFEKEHCTKKKK